MDIVISNTSGTPIYIQIYEQISGQIIKGEMTADEILPSIRTVAKELRISVIPVKRAWEELERNGLIYTMAGKGCFVSPHKSGELDEKKKKIAYERIAEDIRYYKSIGVSLDELTELIKHFYSSDSD